MVRKKINDRIILLENQSMEITLENRRLKSSNEFLVKEIQELKERDNFLETKLKEIDERTNKEFNEMKEILKQEIKELQEEVMDESLHPIKKSPNRLLREWFLGEEKGD
jgi:chemotaxis protein histidine kinase CheA